MSRASARPEDNPIAYGDAQIAYFLHLDPEKLSDEEWATKLKMIAKLRAQENW